MSNTQQCPRRFTPGQDEWTGEGAERRCSYCGSMHPDQFFAAVRAGAEVIPTDKNYKVYVDGAGHSHQKFYLQHLSDEQKAEFISLANDKTMKIGFPGHFYTLPLFCRPA